MSATNTESSSSNGNTYMVAKAGRQEVLFTVYRDGMVRVHVWNAMARTYRTGSGRLFGTWSEALAAFKNANVRAAIEEAERTDAVSKLMSV